MRVRVTGSLRGRRSEKMNQLNTVFHEGLEYDEYLLSLMENEDT